MGKFQELLTKFYRETDFLSHSTPYEARTVQEFANWLDQETLHPDPRSRPLRSHGDCPICEGEGGWIGDAGPVKCALCEGSGKRIA